MEYERASTHKHENSLCVPLPTFCYLVILLLGLSEVHHPQPARRVSVVFTWEANEITTCETVNQHTPPNLCVTGIHGRLGKSDPRGIGGCECCLRLGTCRSDRLCTWSNCWLRH